MFIPIGKNVNPREQRDYEKFESQYRNLFSSVRLVSQVENWVLRDNALES